MSEISQVAQPSCSLHLSNESAALSSKEICNLDDTEWDKLTRSDMAVKLLEYLDQLYDKKDGMFYIILILFKLNLKIKLFKVYNVI